MSEQVSKKTIDSLKEKMRPFMQDMILDLVKEKPENVPLYMLTWLQKYGGFTSTGLTLEEKKELEQLRKDIKQFRDKNEKGSQKEENLSEEDPDDVDNQISYEELIAKKKSSNAPRIGVSAEVYGEFNKKEDFVARKIPKAPEQILSIKARILHSFLFGALEPKDIEVVIGAMEERKFAKDEDVIKQGDNGDCIYIVESGNLDCYKQFKKDEEPKKVKEYGPGDTFGELALLYNSPRAATIRAVTEVVTWVLDRATFINIVKDAAQKKREHYEDVLKKVDILSTIDAYELTQVSDALRSTTFHSGDYIIKEGEIGDVFYILEQGECVATKCLEPGKPDEEIKEYKEGDYFGERALIKGEPRYANIIAKSELVKVISLDRDSFKRLLGPIEEILKRNMDKYQTFIVKAEQGENGEEHKEEEKKEEERPKLEELKDKLEEDEKKEEEKKEEDKQSEEAQNNSEKPSDE